MLLPWLLCALLLLAVIALTVKILLLKKSMTEICTELNEHLLNETNTLICVSTADRHIKRLAAELNNQLRLLRKQRLKYLNGDRELKESITNISHDLRTPLTAVCGYLDLLENTEKSDTVSRYIEAVKNRTEAMKQLTEELFLYSIVSSSCDKAEAQTELVAVGSVLEESIAGFYALLQEKSIIPTVHICEEKVMRTLNRAELARIFANLLSNAVRYSDGDLDITLTESGEVIFVNTASKLDEVQVGKLFDRFYTVEAARKSTGLGLSITRTLIERMNGSISAEYEGDRLRISICLPCN